MSPNSSGAVLIWRRSIARAAVSPSTPPCTIWTEYGFPVRESVISSVPVGRRSPEGELGGPGGMSFCVDGADVVGCAVPIAHDLPESSGGALASALVWEKI